MQGPETLPSIVPETILFFALTPPEMAVLIVGALPRQRARASVFGMPPLIALVALLEKEVLIVAPLPEMAALTAQALPHQRV
jgi:hypothetical protein